MFPSCLAGNPAARSPRLVFQTGKLEPLFEDLADKFIIISGEMIRKMWTRKKNFKKHLYFVNVVFVGSESCRVRVYGSSRRLLCQADNTTKALQVIPHDNI